jgi:hypothetical protein
MNTNWLPINTASRLTDAPDDAVSGRFGRIGSCSDISSNAWPGPAQPVEL